MKICLSCEGVTETQAQWCGFCNARLLDTNAVHYPVRRGEQDAGNPLLGTVIDGKYRLQSVLGRGGLGTVFRAQHVGSLVSVALKLLHPRFAERPEYRQALLPEARRAATVVHERCARLLDVGEGDEGITYLAMELVEGQTLDEVMQRGHLSPSHAVDILLQVADALAAVHQAGLVHCDLSPRNVMVTARSGRLEVKVLDFGIARSMSMAGGGARGELWGFANPAFSAPELLAGGDVDPRADLYSLGTLGWLMLTGTMPVEDGDAHVAADAVREGRLHEWPGAHGVPRRLRRLIEQCVCFDPEQRPASAQEVHRRLGDLRSRRAPVLTRLATFLVAIAVVSLIATDSRATVFLRPQPGSGLKLTDRPFTDDSPISYLRAEELETVVCHYAGFRPTRLRAQIARRGDVLLAEGLRPEVDRDNGTLLLSNAQAGWQLILEALLRTSRDGPVDLTFVVPGSAVLGASRLRLDGEPPTVVAGLQPVGDRLTSASKLSIDAQDDIGLAEVVGTVRFDDGTEVPLASMGASVAIGRLLASELPTVRDVGAGVVTVTARDRAGNVFQATPLPFAHTDVRAPRVLDVTGTDQQRTLTLLGDRLGWRMLLSAGEPGCTMRCWTAGREDHAVERPLALPVGDEPVSVAIEVPAEPLLGGATRFQLFVAVRDPAGNESIHSFQRVAVDRSPSVEIGPRLPSAPVLWGGSELVLGPGGGTLGVTVGAAFQLARARVEEASPRPEPPLVRILSTRANFAELAIGAVAVGEHELVLELVEGVEEQPTSLEHRVALRVLPERIQVQAPTSAARHLPGLVADGVFIRRGKTFADGLGEGPGWSVDPDLRPYLRGTFWSGAEGTVASPVRALRGALLPDHAPVPGHNVVSLELADVLGRPVRFVDNGGGTVATGADDRRVVADYWWTEEPPRLVGEQLLVEYGKPAQLRVRLPLPFAEDQGEQLLLGIPNGEIQAHRVVREGDGSVAYFDLPFAVWSVVTQLAGLSREQYADGLERTIQGYVKTPAGRDAIAVPLRTTRSTLSPMQLGELAKVPPALRGIRLLPVLAPSAPFHEPVPKESPPRFTYRPQHPVDVRGMQDIMLQDREFLWGEARALAAVGQQLRDQDVRGQCLHFNDPLGARRCEPRHLLPQLSPPPPDDTVLTGVDFYQAWTLSRLLGVAVADDPDLFRLPLGCELELAAYAGAVRPGCHAAGAQGGQVRMHAFRRGSAPVGPWRPSVCRDFGDLVPAADDSEFLGLDFGVREWVLDLPHIAGGEALLREWTRAHSTHLQRVMAISTGTANPPPDPLGPQKLVGVVRGLAFGEAHGLLDRRGQRLDPLRHAFLPATVPGVLRSEQLLRDGTDLLGSGRERRLSLVGFRVAGNAAKLATRWGYR